MPDVMPMVATLVVPLLQVPPVEALASVTVVPVHVVVVPVIAAGSAFTVAVMVR